MNSNHLDHGVKMAAAFGIEMVDPATLAAHPANFRKHPQLQLQALEQSLERWGWVKPILVNSRTGRILNGHARVKLALDSGELVPVHYVNVSPEREKDILLEFDRLAAMAETEPQSLMALLASLQEETGELPPGYDQSDIAELEALLTGGGPDDDDEPPKKHRPNVPFALRFTPNQYAQFQALVAQLEDEGESVTLAVMRIVTKAANENLQ